jgi:energy-coupling factor transport system ATP-binding protein
MLSGASNAKLELKNVAFSYSTGTTFEKKVLKNINLKIGASEFIAVIGRTGSGKSTLAQHFNGLLKPTAGEVLYDGENIYADKRGLVKLRQKVGLVFQYPEHQLFETTVFKDVCFGPANLKLPRGEIEKRAREALLNVGIKESYFDKSPFELSGGEKRRAAIAGVLALAPEILILDEPTAGLDPAGRDEILSHIARTRLNLNISVIMISHSMDDAAKLAERVVALNDGTIALDGTVAEVFRETDFLESVGLGAPAVSYLINELNKRGLKIPSAYAVKDAAKIIAERLKGKFDEN